MNTCLLPDEVLTQIFELMPLRCLGRIMRCSKECYYIGNQITVYKEYIKYRECADNQNIKICLWVCLKTKLQTLFKHVYNTNYYHGVYCCWACEEGCFESAKFVYYKYGNEFKTDDIAHMLKSACLYGQLEIAKWVYALEYVYDTDKHTCLNIFYRFNDAIECGHLDTAKWLYDIGANKEIYLINHIVRYKAFNNACYYGKLDMAKWLWELFKGNIEWSKNNNYIFKNACICAGRRNFDDPQTRQNQVNVVAWLWVISSGTINIHADKEYIFRQVCKEGCFEMLLLLWKICGGKINIHACDEYAFRWACRRGHLCVAQWLYSLKDDEEVKKLRYKCNHHRISIHADNEDAFVGACASGNLELAQWLVKLKYKTPIDLYANSRAAFKSACIKGHIHIAQWLLGITDGDIIADLCLDKTFGMACRNGKLEMAQWLLTAVDKNINIHAKNEYALRSALTHKHIDVAKWLYIIDNKCEIEYSTLHKDEMRDGGMCTMVMELAKSLNQV